MSIHLDHIIVPAKHKRAAAQFFADIFGLQVKPGEDYFTQVQIDEHLTFDFADAAEFGNGDNGQSHHYAFHISEADFDAIFARVKAKGIGYGSGPFSARNGEINTRRGGRGFYFKDPNGHLLEVMTVPETGSPQDD